MKPLRLITAVVLFMIFFVWSFWGNYSGFVTPYFPWFFLFFILTLALFSIPPLASRLHTAFYFAQKYAYVIFPFFAFAFSLFLSISVFDSMPHVQDEINYKYLAETILNGSMSSPLHPHYEFFDFLYIIPHISGTYSIYQPGFSLLLALFIFLKIPFLLNPLLTAGTIFMFGKISEDLYDRRIAALSMFLASTSLFLVSMGGTWMAHSFCAICSMGAVYFFIKAARSKKPWHILLSSFFIALLIITRPQNALFIFVPLCISSLFLFKNRNLFKYLLITGSILFTSVIILYYSNYIVTGSMTTPKHRAFFSYTEPDDGCMSIGLHSGCRHSTIIELPDEGLTFKHAAYITHLRLAQLVYGLFFHPLIFIFILIPFLFLNEKKNRFKDFFVLLLFLLTFAGYYLYYFDGNVYGPRYYYEVSFFLLILAARGITLFFGKFKTRSANPLADPVNLFSAFFLAGLLFQFLIFAPPIYKFHKAAFWGTDPKLKETLEQKNITEGVVFISPALYYSSGAALMNLADIDKNKLIFAHDLGPNENRRLMNYYPDRKYYLAFFNKQWFETQPPEIITLNSNELPDVIHVEMESKKYPVDGIPDYCNKYPAWPYIDKYSGFSLDSSLTNGKLYYFCRFKDNSEFYSFGQYFDHEGTYTVKINALKISLGSKFSFSNGSESRSVDFFSESNVYETVDFSMFFNKGMNIIKIKPETIDDRKYSFFIIDSIDFEKNK